MEKPVNPAGSSGYILGEHPTPASLTEEGLEAAALRVPAKRVDGMLPELAAGFDKAADSVIAEITGAKVPEGTSTELSDEELEAATAPKA